MQSMNIHYTVHGARKSSPEKTTMHSRSFGTFMMHILG